MSNPLQKSRLPELGLVRDTLLEMAKTVVTRETTATGVKFIRSKSVLEPADEMFHDTLIQLVEDVRRNELVDIRSREVVCKGLYN